MLLLTASHNDKAHNDKADGVQRGTVKIQVEKKRMAELEKMES